MRTMMTKTGIELRHRSLTEALARWRGTSALLHSLYSICGRLQQQDKHRVMQCWRTVAAQQAYMMTAYRRMQHRLLGTALTNWQRWTVHGRRTQGVMRVQGAVRASAVRHTIVAQQHAIYNTSAAVVQAGVRGALARESGHAMLDMVTHVDRAEQRAKDVAHVTATEERLDHMEDIIAALEQRLHGVRGKLNGAAEATNRVDRKTSGLDLESSISAISVASIPARA